MMINDDIEAILKRGEERTAELNTKYEGLNLEDLSNFKSDASVQQWEGEDFRTGVRSSFFPVFADAHIILNSVRISTSTYSPFRNASANPTTRWTTTSRTHCALDPPRWTKRPRFRRHRSRFRCSCFCHTYERIKADSGVETTSNSSHLV